MKIGVIVAMDKEAQAIVSALGRSKYGLDAHLRISGVGKVNAAIAATEAIKAGCTHIINLGLAGGLDPSMKVGEAYAIDRAVQYDFDLSKVDDKQIGVIDEREAPYFHLNWLERHTRRATIGTADRFGDGDDEVLKGLECTLRDMECAAIAQVCEKWGITFYSYKIVSDVAGSGVTWEQYKKDLETSLEGLGRIAQYVLSSDIK